MLLRTSRLALATPDRRLRRTRIFTITGQNIDWKTNLEDGIKAIREASETTPYDLIITDMYYPETHGVPESQSGILLVDRALEAGWNIPIIVVSTVSRFEMDGVYGSVRYLESEDWENALKKMVQNIKAERGL